MTEDIVNNLLKMHNDNTRYFEMLRQITYPGTEALRIFSESIENRHLFDEVDRLRETMRIVAGPLADLNRSGFFGLDYPIRHEMINAKEIIENYNKSFRLPELNEVSKLLEKCKINLDNDDIRRISEGYLSIRNPWIDKTEELRSIESIIELQKISDSLKSINTFNDNISNIIRSSFGDWRREIVWPEYIFTNCVERSEFYINLGFNSSLTDFPQNAFFEILDLTNIKHDIEIDINDDRYIAYKSENEDEERNIYLTNIAHEHLLRFEICIRNFIEFTMLSAFGNDWIKHHVPGDMIKKWRDKKQSCESKGGKIWPIINYADFTDYETIFIRDDNWSRIYKTIFIRKENLKESFQRLYPIRLCTMHARPITQDDMLYLYAETRRLIKSIFPHLPKNE